MRTKLPSRENRLRAIVKIGLVPSELSTTKPITRKMPTLTETSAPRPSESSDEDAPRTTGLRVGKNFNADPQNQSL